VMYRCWDGEEDDESVPSIPWDDEDEEDLD
jgi:hypothetical protein